MATLHQVDHKGKPTGGSSSSSFPPQPSDAVYARPHHPLHAGVLPVQQPPPGVCIQVEFNPFPTELETNFKLFLFFLKKIEKKRNNVIQK